MSCRARQCPGHRGACGDRLGQAGKRLHQSRGRHGAARSRARRRPELHRSVGALWRAALRGRPAPRSAGEIAGWPRPRIRLNEEESGPRPAFLRSLDLRRSPRHPGHPVATLGGIPATGARRRPSPSQQVQYHVAAATLYLRSNHGPESLNELQAILDDAQQRSVTYRDADRTTRSSAEIARRQITQLIDRYGTAVYQGVEQKARETLTTGKRRAISPRCWRLAGVIPTPPLPPPPSRRRQAARGARKPRRCHLHLP